MEQRTEDGLSPYRAFTRAEWAMLRDDTPMTLTVDDLEAMPSTKLVKDFQCVTGWRVPQVHWEGVKLSDVLVAAGDTLYAFVLN